MTTYPSDWKVVAIGDVAAITTGNKNTQDNDPHGLYPFYVRSEQVERISSFSFDTEGVITAGDGVGTGKVFHYAKGKFGLHQRAYLIHEFRSDVDSKYFYWYFRQNFYHRIHGMSAKSSVDSVRREMIADMEIPLPPLPEQKRIAGVLGDMDKLIENLGKRIEKKRQIKKGAMQELLTGKKRLSGFTGEWVERKIRKMLTIGHGRDYKHLANGTTPVYGSGGLMCYVDGWLHDGETVCIGRKGTIDEPMYHNGKIWTVDTLFYTHSFEDAVPKFLYYKFLMVDWLSHNVASGVPSLTSKTIEEIELLMPPSVNEQRAIAAVLSDMDAEIANLERRQEKLKQVKKGMLQDLLTGKVRLKGQGGAT